MARAKVGSFETEGLGDPAGGRESRYVARSARRGPAGGAGHDSHRRIPPSLGPDANPYARRDSEAESTGFADKGEAVPLDPAIKTVLDQLESVGGPALHEVSPDEARQMMKLLTAIEGEPEAGGPRREHARSPAFRCGCTRARRRARSRSWSGTTAAAGSSAISTRPTASPASSPTAPTRSSCPSTTASRPSTRIPRRSTTAGPCSSGSRRTAPSSAATRPASRSAATAPAATCRRSWRSRRATRASPLRHQLLVYPAVDLTLSFPSIDENGEGYLLTKDSMVWFTEPLRRRRRSEGPADLAVLRRRPERRRAGAHHHRRVRSRCATRARPTPSG